MNKKIKYVYCDLDGTLLKPDKSLPANTLKYFDELRKQGIKIGIITGRSNWFARYEADMVKPDLPLVTINGGIIYESYKDQNNPMFERKMDPDFCKQFMNFLLENKIPALAYINDGILINNPTGKSEYLAWLENRVAGFPKGYDIPFFEMSEHRNTINSIYKFLLMIKETSKEHMDMIQKFLLDHKDKVGDLTSEATLMDIMAIGTSKGDALHYLEEQGYITKDETIVFGDENNDLSMFRVVDESVAMINGTTQAKSTATYITKKTNAEEGVMDFLKEYLK